MLISNINNTITIIYKVVGKGTELMATLTEGVELDCLVGLGNGYTTELSLSYPMVIGGGVGVPPLYNLCKNFNGIKNDILWVPCKCGEYNLPKISQKFVNYFTCILFFTTLS